MTAKHHPESDTAFFRAKRGLGHMTRQTLATGKKHVFSISVATLLASGIGEIKDLLVQHWADQKEDARFANIGRRLIDLEKASAAHDAAQAAYQRGIENSQTKGGHR